jgi:hypothetical protein
MTNDCPKDSVTSQKASVFEVYPVTCREGTEGECSSNLPLILALDGGGVVNATPRPLYSGNDSVTFVQEVG